MATFRYRSRDHGEVAVTHELKNLSELGGLVANGPSVHALEKITVTFIGSDGKTTMEEAS